MTLNAAQRRAVESSAKTRIILAGPGAGKTRTVVEIVRQAAGEGLKVALMTFTNAGAREARERIGECELEYCGTVHGYALELLHDFSRRAGYHGPIAILPEGERDERLQTIAEEMGVKLSKAKLLDRKDPKAELVWREYEFILKRNCLVDFDLILVEAVKLLRLPEVQANRALDLLVIDEGQDSGVLDWTIYTTIPAARMAVVGDLDQSIFAFRGAFPEYLHSFSRRKHAGDEVILLETNYRSDIAICSTADRLILHNTMRIPKRIIPNSTDSGLVAVTRYDDDSAERGAILRLLDGLNLASVAILYRGNHEANGMRNLLMSCGIAVESNAQPIVEAGMQRALLLLSLCVSPGNEFIAEKLLRETNPKDRVMRWRLEMQAGRGSLSERAARGPLATRIEELPRFLAENGVELATTQIVMRRAELLPRDATLLTLLHDLRANETIMPLKVEGITVGTIHSAKGREFDTVFLPAFEQGIIPVLRKDSDIEEERRLAFVGITRARHTLRISWAGLRQGAWGGPEERQPSQFIGEMGL